MTINKYDPQRIVNIIMRQFDKTGNRGLHTMPFAECPEMQRQELLQQLSLPADEIPILVSVFDASNWAVLTTMRLLTRAGTDERQCQWDQLQRCEANMDGLKNHPDPKSLMKNLVVTTDTGERLCLTTDPGPPLIGFWNCLLMAQRMAHEERRRRQL